MIHVQKEPNSILKNKKANASNLVSRHIVELKLPKTTLKAASSTDMVNTSNTLTRTSRSTEIGSSVLSSNSKTSKSHVRFGINKQILTQETSSSGKIVKKTTVVKKKKLYTKTLPKVEDFSESSSYCISQGQVIYEEFWDSDMQEESSSLDSFSTCYHSPNAKEDHIKVVGIKNINYKESKFSEAEDTASVKAPRFVPIADTDKESYDEKAPNILRNIALARKSFASQVFLASLTPPSDKDIAAYNKKKINERKRMVLNKWIEENKTNLKTVPLIRRRCLARSL